MDVISEINMSKVHKPEIIDEFAKIFKTGGAEIGDVPEKSAELSPIEPEEGEIDIKEETSVEKPSEDQNRKVHEESEAKRKAEWEKKQQEKKYTELKVMQDVHAMTDSMAMSASLKKIGTQTERLTRRNMKDCVSEYIQTKCIGNTEFARKTMHPRKNMINCFKYITRHALEFVKQEMEDNGETPSGFNMGGDVPDDLCYQWAEEYFNNMEAEEDKDKDEEFVPKPYYSNFSSKQKKNVDKKPVAKTEEKAKEKKKPVDIGQLSLIEMSLGDTMLEEKVG